MGNQKRINKKNNKTKVPEKCTISKLVNENVFIINTASPNAKMLLSYKDFEIEIWIDKHYEKREKDGDDYGKRDGIEEEIVKDLVIESIKHIFHFYMFNRITGYINFKSNTKYRIILKDHRNTEIPLNVVIQVHSIGIAKYELTIITAMKVNDFKFFDGQYIISLTDTYIKLNRYSMKRLHEIDKTSI